MLLLLPIVVIRKFALSCLGYLTTVPTALFHPNVFVHFEEQRASGRGDDHEYGYKEAQLLESRRPSFGLQLVLHINGVLHFYI
jgi:hypothetical protein